MLKNVPLLVDHDESLDSSVTPGTQSGTAASKELSSEPTSHYSSEENFRNENSHELMTHQVVLYFGPDNEDFQGSNDLTMCPEVDATTSGGCDNLRSEEPILVDSIVMTPSLGHNVGEILDGSFPSDIESERLPDFPTQQSIGETVEEHMQTDFDADNVSNTERCLLAEMRSQTPPIQASPIEEDSAENNSQDRSQQKLFRKIERAERLKIKRRKKDDVLRKQFNDTLNGLLDRQFLLQFEGYLNFLKQSRLTAKHSQARQKY